jgi:hypothetical protein
MMTIPEGFKPWYGYVAYDENSPSCLTWIQTVGRGGSLKHIGNVAGSVSKFGKVARYWRFGLNQETYFNHRVIWEMFNGEIPQGLVINHIDNDYLNNKISNLEVVSTKENNHKTYQHNGLGLNKLNTTGLLGISDYIRNINGKTYYYAHAQFRNKDGRKVQKYFKYDIIDEVSKEIAFKLAREWRKENILSLIAQGSAFYNKENL